MGKRMSIQAIPAILVMVLTLIGMGCCQEAQSDDTQVYLPAGSDDAYVYSTGIPFPPACYWEGICLGTCGGTYAVGSAVSALIGRRLSTGTYYFYETLMVFDVPEIDGTVTDAWVRLYVNSKDAGFMGPLYCYITTANIGANGLGTEDYRAPGWLADSKQAADITAGQYNNWNINADSLMAREGSVLPLRFIAALQVGCAVAPTANHRVFISTYEGANAPYLQIQYTPTAVLRNVYGPIVTHGPSSNPMVRTRK